MWIAHVKRPIACVKRPGYVDSVWEKAWVPHEASMGPAL